MKAKVFFSAIISFFIILLGFNNLSAQQVGQGSIMLGGTFNFESRSWDSDFREDATLFEFAPNVGFFPIDNLGLGLSASYIRFKFDDEVDKFTRIGPYARYYVFAGLFPQVQYIWEKYEDSFFDESETESGFIFSLGYSFFLNSSIAIEPSIYYHTMDSFNSYGMKIGVQAFLGR
ncbi:MAG: hypothetical protein EA362_10390 [Saprospirales bacterium]|nr:MAG: hypothetical protein EA362_10390 [Saprospirales bacterium]